MFADGAALVEREAILEDHGGDFAPWVKLGVFLRLSKTLASCSDYGRRERQCEFEEQRMRVAPRM